MNRRQILVVLAVSSCMLTFGRAEDWPQWRGPQRDGISKETGLLKQWPQGGPKLVWQIKDVGSGYSTPSIVGDQLFVLGNEGKENEFVQCRSVTDGKQLWSTRIGKVGNPDQRPSYPAARSTPTVDGKSLYVLGSDGDLACLETATGKIVWQKNLRTEFSGKPGEWAYSESPLVDGDTLVCTPGGPGATMVALKKQDGSLIWKAAVPGDDAAAYSSIIKVETAGVKQYVQMVAKGVVGIEATTGKFLWRYDRTGSGPANIPTPVANDSGVYTGGARAGAGLVQLEAGEGKVEAKEVYFDPKLPAAIGGFICLGDNLFGTGSAGIMCVDFKSGKVKWTERGIGTGSLCFADGRLYLHGENGDLALIEPSADRYREVGKFTPASAPDRGSSKAWAYPVVANGRLYVRDVNSIWCYDIHE
jgi:outer membrane protein assembly factor BamB